MGRSRGCWGSWGRWFARPVSSCPLLAAAASTGSRNATTGFHNEQGAAGGSGSGHPPWPRCVTSRCQWSPGQARPRKHPGKGREPSEREAVATGATSHGARWRLCQRLAWPGRAPRLGSLWRGERSSFTPPGHGGFALPGRLEIRVEPRPQGPRFPGRGPRHLEHQCYGRGRRGRERPCARLCFHRAAAGLSAGRSPQGRAMAGGRAHASAPRHPLSKGWRWPPRQSNPTAGPLWGG